MSTADTKVFDRDRKLPDGWRWARLGDVCEFLDSRRIPINETERQRRISGKSQFDLFPYYGANGQVGWVDDYIFDEPTILLAEDGGNFGSKEKPIAYTVRGRYWVNNHAHVLKPIDGLIDFDYCCHVLSIRPDVGDLVSGSTRAKLNQEVARTIPLPLPPFPEQRRIAVILNDQLAQVEQAKAAAKAQVEAAKALGGAYLSRMFCGEESMTWPRRRLEELGEIVSGVTLGRKLGNQVTRRVPYLRVANVKDGWLDLDDVYDIEATEEEIGKLRLQYGDLLLTEGGDPDKLGRGTFWSDDIPECIHQNHIFRVRLNQKVIMPQFASLQLCSSYGKSYFLCHAKRTTGIATINRKVLGAFPMMVPSMAVQNRLVGYLYQRLSHCDTLVAGTLEQLRTISSLSTGILCSAFGGRL